MNVNLSFSFTSLSPLGQIEVLVAVVSLELQTSTKPSLHGAVLSEVSGYYYWRKLKYFVFVFTIHVMKVGNLRRDLETLLTLKSEGIDPVDEIVLHLSPLETTALCFPLRSLDISRYHREQHEAQYFPSPCSVHWDR